MTHASCTVQSPQVSAALPGVVVLTGGAQALAHDLTRLPVSWGGSALRVSPCQLLASATALGTAYR